MYFPRFWNSAKSGDVTTWGWSDASLEDARAKAQERQQRVLAWLQRGDGRLADTYGYPDRPMREEVLREFRGADGQVTGAVSRNACGCLVLNTAGLVFVDVDTPEPEPGAMLRKLFRRSSPDPQAALEQKLTELAEQWVSAQPDWTWRLYRTRAGVRLMATHGPVTPDQPAIAQAFEAFNADPRYRALCQSQKCFRARLTPKPWRCDAPNPSVRWPWHDARAEQKFREWERAYLAKANAYATCKLIAAVGPAPMAVSLAPMIQAHDDATRSSSDLPLA